MLKFTILELDAVFFKLDNSALDAGVRHWMILT